MVSALGGRAAGITEWTAAEAKNVGFGPRATMDGPREEQLHRNRFGGAGREAGFTHRPRRRRLVGHAERHRLARPFTSCKGNLHGAFRQYRFTLAHVPRLWDSCCPKVM